MSFAAIRSPLTVRTLTMAEDDAEHAPHLLICDPDRKWTGDLQRQPSDARIRVVVTPERAPNANAYAERVVRSIKEEWLDRLILIGTSISGGAWRSTSSTITANRIIRDSTIGSSRASR